MNLPSDEEVYDMVESLKDRMIDDALDEAVDRVAQHLGADPFEILHIHTRIDER